MDAITKQKNFWSDDDEMVLKAIREGFLTTQQVCSNFSVYLCHLKTDCSQILIGYVERPSQLA